MIHTRGSTRDKVFHVSIVGLMVALERYVEHLGDLVLTRPGEASGHLCVINCQTPVIRSLYESSLARNPFVQSSIHYPLPPSARRTCPVAADLSDRILSVPCHADMTYYDVRRVIMRLLQA